MIEGRLSFGLAKQERKKNEEKYPDLPVLTVYAKPEEGRAYKFHLNLLAAEKLEVEKDSKVSIAFRSVNNVPYAVIANLKSFEAEVPSKSKGRVTGSNTFSSAPLHKGILNDYNLSETEEHEFVLKEMDVEHDNMEIISMQLIPMSEYQSQQDSEIEEEEKEEEKENGEKDGEEPASESLEEADEANTNSVFPG